MMFESNAGPDHQSALRVRQHPVAPVAHPLSGLAGPNARARPLARWISIPRARPSGIALYLCRRTS
jgi:hypothetical protein